MNTCKMLRRISIKKWKYKNPMFYTIVEGYLVSYTSRQSLKILVGFWLISMVVLINAYAGVMTALLTAPKLMPIVNTLEEAVTQNRLVTMHTTSLMYEFISVRCIKLEFTLTPCKF